MLHQKLSTIPVSSQNEAERQFTMCHKLGHGLGMGHLDKDFRNPDSGNFMDYTNTLKNNLHPDKYNFQILEELYSNVKQERAKSRGIFLAGARPTRRDA